MDLQLHAAEQLLASGEAAEGLDAICRLLRLEPATPQDRSVLREARILRAKQMLANAAEVKAHPARASELGARFGFDAVMSCELAINDIDVVLTEEPSNHAALVLRAEIADCSLPQDARRYAISGLSLYPADETLLRIAAAHPSPLAGRVTAEALSELDCVLCARLLLDPVTTACGHTFCRLCLVKALEHASVTFGGSQVCPMCRCPLHMSATTHPATVLIAKLI